MRRSRNRNRRALAAACIMTAALAGTAHAAPGGNSENAKLCQKGGWQTLQTAAGDLFANQGDCVSYAAHGGTLVAISDPDEGGDGDGGSGGGSE